MDVPLDAVVRHPALQLIRNVWLRMTVAVHATIGCFDEPRALHVNETQSVAEIASGFLVAATSGRAAKGGVVATAGAEQLRPGWPSPG
jgi:hypothetical protein